MRTFGAAEDRSSVKFLELGCGFGAQLRFLWEEGFDAEGIDGSQTAVDYAKALPGRRGLVVHGDLEHFLAADGDGYRYDCIVDVCTLQHISPGQNAKLIAKAREWLKPGGWIFSKHVAWGPKVYHWHDPSSGIPAPGGLFEDGIPHLFPGFSLQVAREIVIDPERRERHHWIITGRKV